MRKIYTAFLLTAIAITSTGAGAQSLGDILNRAKGTVGMPGSSTIQVPGTSGTSTSDAASVNSSISAQGGAGLPANVERMVDAAVSMCKPFLLESGESDLAFVKRMIDNHVNEMVLIERQSQYQDLKAKAVAADSRVSNYTGQVFDTKNVKEKLGECDSRFPQVIAALKQPKLRIVNSTGQDICNFRMRSMNGNSDNIPNTLVIKAGSTYIFDLIETHQSNKQFSATNCDRTQRLFAVKDLKFSSDTELVLGSRNNSIPAAGFTQLVVPAAPKACRTLEMTSTGSNCDVIKDANQRNLCLARDPRKTRSLGTTQECDELL